MALPHGSLPLDCPVLYEGVVAPREMKLVGDSSQPARNFLLTLNHPTLLQGPPESAAIKREGEVLRGHARSFAELGSNPNELLLKPSSLAPVTLDGMKYVEFPNSTMLQTVDPATGKKSLFSDGARRATLRYRR